MSSKNTSMTPGELSRIIENLVLGKDYRIVVVSLINKDFLDFVIKFFKEVAEAKMDDKDIDLSWYRTRFLSSDLEKDEIAIHSGLNMKTIYDQFGSTKKELVIDVSSDHYDELIQLINEIVERDKSIDLSLTIKFKKVSVELSLNESLLVINTLAVKRAQLRGGLWSIAGKRVEGPLMLTLCKILQVDPQYYVLKGEKDKIIKDDKLPFDREVDFYLVDKSGKQKKTEVKLMGKGNPESADAFYARDSNIFVADKLSDQNKAQLDHNGVFWVEMDSGQALQQFSIILKKLGIPFELPEKITIDKIRQAIGEVLG